MRLKCPHCQSPMRHRTTRALTPLISETYHVCRNDDCGFKCKAIVEVVGCLHQAIMPNPAIALPMITRQRCEQQPVEEPAA